MVLRFLLRLVVLVGLVFVVLIGSLFLISGERLAKIASDQVTSLSGRDVNVTGSLRPQLFPNLGVRTGAFEVAGNPSEVPLISGEALSVGVDLEALFSRRIDVKDVTLVSPVINLVRNADGRANWSSGNDDTATSGPGGPLPAITLTALSVQDATLRFEDRTTGTRLVIEQADLTAAMPMSDAPLTVEANFVAAGQSATAAVEVASLATLLAGDLTALSVSADVAGNTLSYVGDMALDGRLEGDLAAFIPNPGALTAMSGGDANAPVPPNVLPIEVAGTVSASPQQIDISGGSYRAGENGLSGPVSITLSDVPYVAATLTSPALNLSAFAAEEGSATEAEAAAGTGWSSDPIDASGVDLLDADIQIDATQVDLGSTQMRDVVLTLTIENARAVARILQAQAFGGDLTGRFVVNNRNGLSVAGDMDGRTVAVQALLTDLAGFDRMRGAGDTKLSFLGVGQSMDQIMRSLSGDGRLEIGQGDITGFDLTSMFNGAEDAVNNAATTIFQSLTGSFTINDGVLRNRDLKIAASLFEANGEGSIDLGNQRLDYVMIPEVFENQVTRGLSIPVRFKGPWSKPRIYPDLEYAAAQKLDAEKAKLEAEAKAQVEEEKQKVEDKVKSKVEEKLRRGLGGLFGD